MFLRLVFLIILIFNFAFSYSINEVVEVREDSCVIITYNANYPNVPYGYDYYKEYNNKICMESGSFVTNAYGYEVILDSTIDIGNSAVCAHPAYRYTPIDCCKEDNKYIKGLECVEIPDYVCPDENKELVDGYCECKNNFIDFYGSCVQKCSFGEKFDSITASCVSCGVQTVDSYTVIYDDSCSDNPQGVEFGKLTKKNDFVEWTDYENGLSYISTPEYSLTRETWPDGSTWDTIDYISGDKDVIINDSDGTTTTTRYNNDGSKIVSQLNPDGSNSTVYFEPENGNYISEAKSVDGDIQKIEYDSENDKLSIFNKFNDGTFETSEIDLKANNEHVEFSDGTIVESEISEDGAKVITQTNIDGSKAQTVIKPNGDITTSLSNGFSMSGGKNGDTYNITSTSSGGSTVISNSDFAADSNIKHETTLVRPDGSQKVVTEFNDNTAKVQEYDSNNNLISEKDIFDGDICIDGAPPLNETCDRPCESVGYTTMYNEAGEIYCEKPFDTCEEPRNHCAYDICGGMDKFFSFDCLTQDCHCKKDRNACIQACGGEDNILSYQEGSSFLSYDCQCRPPLKPPPEQNLSNPQDNQIDMNNDNNINCEDLFTQCTSHCGIGNVKVNVCEMDYITGNPESKCECIVDFYNENGESTYGDNTDYINFLNQSKQYCKDRGSSLYTGDYSAKTFICYDDLKNPIQFNTDSSNIDNSGSQDNQDNLACFTPDGKKGMLLDGICVPLSTGSGASGENIEDYLNSNTEALKENTQAIKDNLNSNTEAINENTEAIKGLDFNGLKTSIDDLSNSLNPDTSGVNFGMPDENVLDGLNDYINNSETDLIDFFTDELSSFNKNFLNNLDTYKKSFDDTKALFSTPKAYKLITVTSTTCFTFTIGTKTYSFDLVPYASMVAPYFSLFINLLFMSYSIYFALTHFVRGD